MMKNRRIEAGNTRLMKKIVSGIVTFTMAGALCLTTVSATSTTTDITPSDNVGNGTGGSTVTMAGATIPAPTYIVTIPEKIEFGEVSKKLSSISLEDATAKTAESPVTVDYEYLFENQKNVSVTMSTDNKIVNGTNELPFDVYKADGTKLTSGATIFSIQPTAVEKNRVEQNIYATLDQRAIKASGNYTGTVTFTVAMADNK